MTKLGRSLIVFPAMSDGIRIDTGQRLAKGSVGSTEKLTKHFGESLPFDLALDPGRGTEIQPRGPHAAALWRGAKGWFLYRGSLNKYPGDPLFCIRGTEKIVGSMQRTDAGGWYFVLPEPWCEREDDDDFDPPSREDDDWVDAPQKLIDWAVALTGHAVEDKPGWLVDYSFPESAEFETRIIELDEELAQVLTKMDQVKAEQAEDDLWKVLIYGQGDSLEKQVSRAFEFLGFDIQEAIEGRADLRVSYDGKMAVVEVKGLAKSAAEKNAAQLEKWVSEEISGGADQPKPILVANTWRDKRPDERGEIDFPDQMLKYVRDRGHCLVSGSQLLAMVRAAYRDPGKKKDIAAELMSTVGTISGWGIGEALIRTVADSTQD